MRNSNIFLLPPLWLLTCAPAFAGQSGNNAEPVLWGVQGILLLFVVFLIYRLRSAQAQIQTLNTGVEQRVETLWQQRVAELRTLIENVPDPIFRYDRNCRRVYINPAVERISSASATGLLGKTPTESDLTHSADGVKIQQCIERVLKTGKPETVEVTYIAQNGSELVFQHIHVPEFGKDGSVESVLSIGRDMTSRKQFERVLQQHLELEQRQSQFFNVVPGYFYTLEHRPDDSYAMTFASSGIREMYGVSPEAVMQDISAFVAVSHPDDVEMTFSKAEESGRDLIPYHVEYRIVHPTKGLRWIEAHSLPQRMPGGGTRWDGFMHDITERKEAEQQLKLKEFALDQASEAVYLLDGNLQFIYVNEEACRALEYSREELLGLTPSDIDPNVTEADLQHIAKQLENGGHFTFETRHRRRDGSEFPVEIRGTYLEYQGQTMSMSLVRDISQRKRIEAELENEKQRLKAFFHALPNMAWIKDMDGKYLACNPIFESLFGAPEAEIVGKTDYDFVDAELADFFRQKDREAVAAGIPTVNEEWVCYASDQHWALLETIKAPLRDAEGRIIGVLGLAQDITERKQAEITIRESEARYRASSDLLHSILESSPDVITFALDCNYRYVAFNSKHQKTMKAIWGKEIALGMNMLDVIGSQSDREATKHNLDCALSGESFALEEHYGDERLSREYWQAFWSPIRSDAGVIVGLTCFVLNISWRKRMEVELANSRNFLDKIVNAVSVPLFVKDRQHRFVMMNDACSRMIGHPREELLGKCDDDFFSEEQAKLFWDKDEQVFTSGELLVTEETVTNKNGETYHLYTTKTPFRSSDGEAYLVGVILDITERRRHEIERENTQKKLSEQHAQLQRYQNELELLVKERTTELVASNKLLQVEIEVREQIEERLKRAIEFTEGVINAIPDVLFEVNGEGRYLNVWTQSPQLLAAQKETLLGKTIREVLSPDAAEIAMNALEEANVNGTSFGKVIRISLPGGDSWFELSVAKKSAPDLRESHFIVLSRNITGRKQIEQALVESREQLSGLIAHREEVREEERKYIAREVHDELGQILSGLQLNISLLDFKFSENSPALHDYVQETMNLTDKAIQAVRHIASALRPVELDMGIVAALKWQTERFGSHSGIQCEIRIPDEEITLEETQAIALFRIVQESLTNILRHARADKVVISLLKDGDDYVLKVRDNGKGFDPNRKKKDSFGLVGIRERALMLGGVASINSGPGGGTEIIVSIPRAAHRKQ
jgi:PAS domain S-box-containing protein